jgi:hypothetical protein
LLDGLFFAHAKPWRSRSAFLPRASELWVHSTLDQRHACSSYSFQTGSFSMENESIEPPHVFLRSIGSRSLRTRKQNLVAVEGIEPTRPVKGGGF